MALILAIKEDEMRGEIDFQKYSQRLGNGLFADNVILSILDYKENRNLEPKEKEALKRAKNSLMM